MMTTITQPLMLPVTQKIFGVTGGLTSTEFLENTPALAKLLRQRLNEVRIPPAIQDFLVAYPEILNFAVIVSEEAPETAIVLPIWMRIERLSSRLSLRIFRDTDPLNLLNQLVDELDLIEDLGEMELPLCLIFDEEWNYQAQWGPHPQAIESLLDQWFEQHREYEALAEEDTPEAQQEYGLLIQELTQQMRVWYNSGLDRACLQEIRDLLATLREDEEHEAGAEEDQ